MNPIDFLAKIAEKTHFDPEFNSLLDTQSAETKRAFLTNDADLVKKQFTHQKNCFEQAVVCI